MINFYLVIIIIIIIYFFFFWGAPPCLLRPHAFCAPTWICHWYTFLSLATSVEHLKQGHWGQKEHECHHLWREQTFGTCQKSLLPAYLIGTVIDNRNRVHYSTYVCIVDRLDENQIPVEPTSNDNMWDCALLAHQKVCQSWIWQNYE